MVMTSDQIAAELQRKRNLGKAPDNPANQAIYDKLKPTTTPTFNAYGGKDSYAANQNTRFQAANESGDTDLISRLQADSKRAGYALNPYTPKTTTTNNAASANPTSNDLLTSIRDLMTKQSAKELPQFNYDPTSDPVYQSALNRAKANSDTASGNAQAELNRRGILNSTITSDRLGQIQQAEYGRVSDEILPQLFQQAYGRYRDTVGDQYQAGRDQIGDMGTLLDYQTGREDTQYGRDYQTGRDKVADSQWSQTFVEDKKRYGEDVAYKKARDSITDGQWKQQFDEDVRRYGLDYGLQQQQNRISQQNANTSSFSASTSRASLDWSKDPSNPDNIYKNKQIDALDNPQGSRAEDYYSFIDSSPSAFTKDEDGKTVQNSGVVEDMILSSGLSNAEMAKLYRRYGIPMDN